MKPYPRSILFLLTIFVVSISVLGAPWALNGQEAARPEKAQSAAEDSLKPIPEPQLEHFEKAVSNQLREKRKKTEAIAKNLKESREKRSLAYGELGQLYHAYELNDAAEACYHNALILDPSCFEWTYSLGCLLQSVGQFEKAIRYYKLAETTQKGSRMVYLLYIRIGECYRNLNQPERAKLAFRVAFQVNREGPAVLARLGEIALEEKRYDDAIKLITSALEKQPAANKLHYPLGMAYRSKGDMDKARYHLSKYGMVGVQPPDPLKAHLKNLMTGYWTHILAGKRAFSAKRYQEAAEAFNKAVESEPEKVEAKINLGTTLAQLKKYEEAITRFRTALEIAPDNETAHFNLGMLYGYLGKHKEAIKHLQFVINKNPKDSQAYLALANALQSDQQFREAIAHYKTALSLDPGLTWGWVDLSVSLGSVGQHAEALRILEEGHSRLPHDGPIAHALAHLLAASPEINKRQGKRALELAAKVFKASNYYEHARTVALAYAELNQCDKAVKWLEKAIALAKASRQADSILNVLKRNLAHFKSKRPCRVPGK